MVSSSPVLNDVKRSASFDGIRVQHWRFNGGELPAHSHHEHAVLIVLSDGAKGEFRTESGRGMFGTEVKGCVAVLPAGLEHAAVLDGPSEHLSLFIDPALIKRAGVETAVGSVELVEKYSRGDELILNVGLALKKEMYSEGLGSRLYADSLTNLLAVHLLRHYSLPLDKPPSYHGGMSAKKLRRVQDFMSENYTGNLRLEVLADVAGMSRFHFSREFKRSTGITPHQYLIKMRVERAKALLATPNMPLTEVGLRSGFSHQSHFTRLFRRITGTTPGSYRNNLQ